MILRFNIIIPVIKPEKPVFGLVKVANNASVPFTLN